MNHLSIGEQFQAIADNFSRIFGEQPTPRKVAPTPRKVAPTPRKVAPTPRKVAPTPRKVAPTTRGVFVRQPKGPGYQVGFSNAECTAALRQSKGNVARAAATLGVTPQAISYRLNNFSGVFPKGYKRLGRGRPSA